MDDEASRDRSTGSDGDAAVQPVPASAPFHADRRPMKPGVERRLRRLAGRKGAYRGPIVATTRGWISRDVRWHAFAARFLDFVVITPEHLVLCSTGFFTRRPRRQVLREPLSRLSVTKIGSAPAHAVRIVGDFSRPIRLELRDEPASAKFVDELIARTPLESARRRGDPWSADEMEALPPVDEPRAIEAGRTGDREVEAE